MSFLLGKHGRFASRKPQTNTSEGLNLVTVFITGLKQRRLSDWPNTKNICPQFPLTRFIFSIRTSRCEMTESHDFGVMCNSQLSTMLLAFNFSRETVLSISEQHRDGIFPAPFTELLFDIYVLNCRSLAIYSRQRELGAELVRHYLRTLYSVHQDREIIVRSSPEPLIAEVAALLHNLENGAPYII